MPLANWNAAVPEDNTPNIFFVVARCATCHTHWAICADLEHNTAETIWFFDGRYVPSFPPKYIVDGHSIFICPEPSCEKSMLELKSRWAMVTAEGKWLFLDKTLGSG